MVILKLKSSIFACGQNYSIDNKNANETNKNSKIFTWKQYKINAAGICKRYGDRDDIKTELIKKITPGGSSQSLCSVLV